MERNVAGSKPEVGTITEIENRTVKFKILIKIKIFLADFTPRIGIAFKRRTDLFKVLFLLNNYPLCSQTVELSPRFFREPKKK